MISRLIITGTHFAISLLVVGVFALLVRLLWYPGPFFEFSGAVGLLSILIPVDVVLGPLLTFVISNPEKTRSSLIFDVSVVVSLQAAALFYGAWAILEARPVFAVFVGDAIYMVRSADVTPHRPWLSPLRGPEWVALPVSGAVDAEIQSIVTSLKGERPALYDTERYLPLENRRDQFLAAMRETSEVEGLAAGEGLRDVIGKKSAQAKDIGLLTIMIRDEPMTGIFDIRNLELVDIEPVPIH